MFILRIDYASGLRIDFGFITRAAAEAAVLGAQNGDDAILITDDHGHTGYLRRDGIIAMVLTDLAAEVAGQLAVQRHVEAARAMVAAEDTGLPSPFSPPFS